MFSIHPKDIDFINFVINILLLIFQDMDWIRLSVGDETYTELKKYGMDSLLTRRTPSLLTSSRVLFLYTISMIIRKIKRKFPECYGKRISCSRGRKVKYYTLPRIYNAWIVKSSYVIYLGFLGDLLVKNLPANEQDIGDMRLIPGSGRSPGGGNATLQYSCLGNPMDKTAWQTTVHGITESDWAHKSHNL